MNECESERKEAIAFALNGSIEPEYVTFEAKSERLLAIRRRSSIRQRETKKKKKKRLLACWQMQISSRAEQMIQITTDDDDNCSGAWLCVKFCSSNQPTHQPLQLITNNERINQTPSSSRIESTRNILSSRVKHAPRAAIISCIISGVSKNFLIECKL